MIKKKLIHIYELIKKEKGKLTLEQVNDLKQNVKALIDKKSNILKNFEMFEEEKDIMCMFFVPGMLENPDRQSQLSKSQINNSITQKSQNGSIHKSKILTDPLLEMIGKERIKKELEKRITTIRKNADPNSEECIICFSALEDPLCKIVLKCKHCFHTVCLFDWLKINPSCPMCRKNFRLDLLYAILKYLDQMVFKKSANVSYSNTIPLLGEHNA